MVIYKCVIDGVQSNFTSRNDLPISMIYLGQEGEWGKFQDMCRDSIIYVDVNGMFKFFPESSGKYYTASITYGNKTYNRTIIKSKPTHSILVGNVESE